MKLTQILISSQARSLRHMRAAGVALCVVFSWPSLAATTTSANKPVTLDQASFKIINDNNIFDPKRYGGFQRTERTVKTGSTRQADYFALVGIMSYDKGPFAFFEGSKSEYSKVAKPNDSIAGFKVTGIESNNVQLVSGTNKVAMPINMQMRREEGTSEWKLAARSDSYVASYDRNDRSRYDRNSRNRYNNSRDNRDNRNYNQRDQTPVMVDGTNQPEVVVVGQDEQPDFPPPDAAVEQGQGQAQGSDTNEDPVLRLLRLRREQENNP